MSNNKNVTPADVIAAGKKSNAETDEMISQSAPTNKPSVPNQVVPENESVTEEIVEDESTSFASRLKNFTSLLKKNKKVLVALGTVAAVTAVAILKAKANAEAETTVEDEVSEDAVSDETAV